MLHYPHLKMKTINRIWYIILALAEQGPPKRFIKNLLSGRMLGLFHWRSHHTFRNGEPAEKIGYTTKKLRGRKTDRNERKTKYCFRQL